MQLILFVLFGLTASVHIVGSKEVLCEPNVRVMRGCNICVCSPDGSNLACSTQPCSPNVASPSSLGVLKGNDVVCRAGTAFHAECNICRCSLQGNDIICTRKLCLASDASLAKTDEQN